MSKSTYRRSAELLEADLNDELVGLDPQGGNCFGFNATATRIWRLLAVPRSMDEIRDVLVDEYDVEPGQCEAELTELLDHLIDSGLLERA